MAIILSKKKSDLYKHYFFNFLFIVPAVAIFATFYIYPFYDILKLSFHEWNGIDSSKVFVGLDNFKELMQDQDWWKSIGHASFITFIALTIQNLFAFILAFACDRELRMKNFYRVVFFIPPVLSEIVVGLVWVWILNADVHAGEQVGLLNHMLVKTGLPHLVNDWLSNPKTALSCIAIVHSWKGFGWAFILFLAGLQTIDRDVYEAAKVDGANMWVVLKNVTLPLMVPVIIVVVILTILGSMQSFILIIAMMGDGLVDYTSVPVTEILLSMRGLSRFGYACAQGITFGVILICVSFGLKQLEKIKQV
ncbi:MAG: raffinose/stachyose/melibiose transport system permease protein [Candidatus Omnitrophota bacterium]|jgi:raffinose/stachyose/melibiose transport system permease protein